jgi:hypothetical protein
MDFGEALNFLTRKRLMPTNLGSRELKQLDADVRAKSLFSARNTNLGILSQIQDSLTGLLEGEFNEATARMQIQLAIRSTGYKPETGFPGDEGRNIPSANPESLQDLSSDRRIRLVTETNMRQALGFARNITGNSETAREEFPAWELVRVWPRRVEREDWKTRFTRAGGTLAVGRMVALKDDSVWDNLGSTELFDDGLGQPFEPYAWGSGMGRVPVDRDKALSLGVITNDYVPSETKSRFFDERNLNADQFDVGELRQLLEGIR